MDARHFDALARTVTEMGTRRGLLALLAMLPLLGGLFALLAPEETDAAGRRKRRKKRHKHSKGQRRRKNNNKQQKKCKAKSRARICANRCGIIKNKQTCKKKINCGPCACDPSCPVCQTCNEATGACEPDSSQQGDECGAPGQVCQSDGKCACDATSCAPCEECQQDGVCSLPCDGVGCCDDGDCVSGLDTGACGRNGEACITCTGPGNTCGGSGQDGVCGCTPTSCAAEGKDCGTIADGCGSTDDCGTCPFLNQPCDDNVCGTCVPDCDGKACGADDGCGAPCLDGTCPAPDTCGGGNPGTPGVCGCTPKTCAAFPGQCGTFSDGCGETFTCDCAAPQTCGGGGTPGFCGCIPQTCSQAGKNCGTIPNTCGGSAIDCGTCTAPSTCGGGSPGTPGVCGCTKTTCAAQGKTCGTIPDGCGGMLECGSCAVPGEICGGGGVPNVCGNPQGTCAAGANMCTSTGDFFDCNGGGGACVCVPSIEGTTACANFAAQIVCGSCTTSSSQCPSGSVCVSVTGNNCNTGCQPGAYACQPVCPLAG